MDIGYVPTLGEPDFYVAEHFVQMGHFDKKNEKISHMMPRTTCTPFLPQSLDGLSVEAILGRGCLLENWVRTKLFKRG
jgi:hypothetical protein